jgi:integrase
MSGGKTPYVQRVVRKDGRIDLYFRKGDWREGPLTHPDGSEALRAEVDAILKRIADQQAARAPRPGTVGAMLRLYNRSAEFLACARSTQASYQRLIDELLDDCGEVTLREVTTAWVREMRDAWAPRGHRAANLRLQVLTNALAPAIADESIERDPFARVPKVRRPHEKGEAHPIWEDLEIAAAIADCLQRIGKEQRLRNPGLARAIALGRYGGFRRGTICTIPLHARTISQHVGTGEDEVRLYWITEKRKVLCDKREDPRLTRLLTETPNRALTIAYNADGQPWQPRQLNQAFDRMIARLAKTGKARANLTIHGLRHSRGVELALAGASDAEIMAQLEHATDRQAKEYRRQAHRRALADQGQDRIDRVVELQASRSRSSPVRTTGERPL